VSGDTAVRRPGVNALKTVAVLLLLLVALPFNLALVASALLRGLVLRSPQQTSPDPKTVLISGGKMTKALQLARSFHRAGHRVVLIESHKYRLTGHRFSRSVDRFFSVPAPQETGYVDALVQIVRRERIDVYVPVCSPVASYYDALAKLALSPFCEVFSCDAELIQRLDDKNEFAALARSLGLSVPDSRRITTPEQVANFDFEGSDRPYVLKSIPYDPVQRLDLTELPRGTRQATVDFVRTKSISEATPWIMQAFIPGMEYCTHSTVRNGNIQLHCCCRSSAFQLNYEMVDHPQIEAWVTTFVGALRLTGQISFDFIQAHDGTVYAIECNPRTHSAITMFYNHPGVADAYLDDDVPAIRPLESSRPTYWSRLKTIRRGKDAIFDWSDPLPFLMQHHLQIPWLLLQNLRGVNDWTRIDFNIGKLVEPAGD
jgi:predicted ATP-grasp superfamily ATP-dependent carboligase